MLHCMHGHVGPLCLSFIKLLAKLTSSIFSVCVLLSSALTAESVRACETWSQCVREGHTAGLDVKRGLGTGQKRVAEGEQIERSW